MQVPVLGAFKLLIDAQTNIFLHLREIHNRIRQGWLESACVICFFCFCFVLFCLFVCLLVCFCIVMH